RSAGTNRKEALHLAPELVEVRLQDRRPLRDGKRTELELANEAALAQDDGAGGLRIPHPLRVAARSDEVALAPELEQVDRHRVQVSALPTADFQQVGVPKAEAEAYQGAEQTIEQAIDGARLLESGYGIAHWRSSSGERPRFDDRSAHVNRSLVNDR